MELLAIQRERYSLGFSANISRFQFTEFLEHITPLSRGWYFNSFPSAIFLAFQRVIWVTRISLNKFEKVAEHTHWHRTSRTCFTTASVVPNKSTPVIPLTSDSTAPGDRFFFLRPCRTKGKEKQGGGSRRYIIKATFLIQNQVECSPMLFIYIFRWKVRTWRSGRGGEISRTPFHFLQKHKLRLDIPKRKVCTAVHHWKDHLSSLGHRQRHFSKGLRHSDFSSSHSSFTELSLQFSGDFSAMPLCPNP